jgi:Rps23 Pro-64 3,4-dihydroxylase Tpa1-like proline 4-hydroxylase
MLKPALMRKGAIIMQIKVIYEDEAVPSLKQQIAALDTEQLYFIELWIRQLRASRKETIFQEWKEALYKLVNQV